MVMVVAQADLESLIKPLGRWSVFYYGVGHMLNDITAACWFTYLLVFLTDIGLPPGDVAIVMLSGQVADAIMVIFAGELIDRYGHFKIWHGAGSVLVAVSFSSVFGDCLPCKIFGTNSIMMQTVSYSVFSAIFNMGWAAAQVSHMAMVNCITLNSTSRVMLTSCRNAFTMVANLSLYAVAIAVFSVTNPKTHLDIENQYRWIAYLSIFLGCCFVAIFLFGTKEPRSNQVTPGKVGQRIAWSFWLKKLLYYQVALLYMLTRLVTNVSQALLAFYVIYDLKMGQSSKAVVPALIYICSFAASIALQEMTWTGQRLKVYFTAGSVLWIISGAGILILPSSMHSIMYLLSVTIGVANALMTVTCISMQSVLVGEDINGSGMVYGTLSFLDKMSCGIALYFIESYQGTATTSLSSCHSITGCLSLTRYGLGLVPAVCAFLGVIITYTMDLGTTTPSSPRLLTEPLLATSPRLLGEPLLA